LDAVEFEVDVDVAGAAASGDVADDEAAEMARKGEWAEWLEKVVHDRWRRWWVAGVCASDGVMSSMPGRHLSIEGKVCTGHFGREKVDEGESEVGAKKREESNFY
jgi:hypothetical protein